MYMCVPVAVCMNNVCTQIMTVYLIAVETKMYFEMLQFQYMEKSESRIITYFNNTFTYKINIKKLLYQNKTILCTYNW